jgi:serine/threonine-protein kinase
MLILIVAGVVGLVYVAFRYVFPDVVPDRPTPTPTATLSPTDLPTVLVPDLTDLSAEEARARLEELGLQYQEGRPSYDPYVEPGNVMSQEPPYGESVPNGTVVTVVLSAQPGLARVPRVVGMSFAAAKLKMEQAGFRVGEGEASCSSAPAGTVDSQDPRDGIEEIQGITVTLYVSIGDEAIVPELLRVPLREAQQRVEEAGLTWGFANPQTQEHMPPGVDIDDLGAPGQVISYEIHYGSVRKTSGELTPGDHLPCGAVVYVAYYATEP